jgi:hypothetical protein
MAAPSIAAAFTIPPGIMDTTPKIALPTMAQPTVAQPTYPSTKSWNVGILSV